MLRPVARQNPLRAVFQIQRNELPLALLMFTYFFVVITSFWVLKPIKKSLFIQYYETSGVDLLSWHLSGPQAELIAKVLNMFVAVVAVTVFTWLARRLRRQQLTFVFTAFFLACYLAYSTVLGEPGHFTVWSFYLFGDLFSTLMVATFFTDFSAVRWLSAFTIPIIVLWVVAVRYAGREFARRTEGSGPP